MESESTAVLKETVKLRKRRVNKAFAKERIEEIRYLYYSKFLTHTEIANILNVAPQYVGVVVRKYGKPISEGGSQ